ncbi:unnamed protein product [Ambrosiozyma monospora]|uniref:Unnamed protein product n=1 Tax=Ambrosiozyma monospora TaxID=43982 RepID=A0ACB5TS12_AMBMO|nr:unnamed protein product [Ambrosiozyma monospora]
MQIFRIRYPLVPSHFSSIARTHQWREELIKRELLLKNWRKGKGFQNTFTLNDLLFVSDLHADFQNNRMLAFDTHTGRLLTCNINNGSSMDSNISSVPSGTTSYDISKHFIFYGRWDGKVFGSLINHKNILMSGIKEFQNPQHQGMITAIHLIKTDLAKQGKMGGFSGDQHGNLRGWDLKKGEKMLSLNISSLPLVKIESNGKDVIVVLSNNGDLFIIDNVFNLFDPSPKVTKLYHFENEEEDDQISTKMIVDYGGQKIILYNNHKLEIISYASDNFGNYCTLVLELNESIYKASLEQNNTQFSVQDKDMVGGDPLMMGVLLRSADKR